ncbi:MAG TPA: gamma-glutamyl-gamma-aminobutyrate hydrolase family protein [Thermodesulfobacteriota bacterium]|nr:gamma-glutamyl-gamma-aminobutyrate hydrolase family protein [Thermodesulfobacteriota bacterium]
MDRKRPVIGITTDIKDGSFVIEDAYARAVAKAGGIPILIPSIPESPGLLKETVSRIDGLLLPGSRDMDPKFYNEEPHPKLRPMSIERTETELIVLNESRERNIPVLGICGGMQLLNVFFGGSLYQDISSLLPDAMPHEKGAVHDILIEDGTLLHKMSGANKFQVNSYHHQALKEIGMGLRVSATAPDGIVEGIESRGEPRYVLGIQWHPEREQSELADRIFESFIEECRKG